MTIKHLRDKIREFEIFKFFNAFTTLMISQVFVVQLPSCATFNVKYSN